MSGMDRVFAFRERDRRLALDPQQTTPSALTCNESSAGISNPSSRCTLKWWFDKVKGGVEKHDSRLNLFSQSPFSFLLHISSFRFIGALFHLLFLRYKGDLVFEIGGRRLQFTEMDFALITGLKIGELTIPKNRPTTSTLRDKYFKEYPVLKKHLMDVFERLVDTNKHEDVVKVALLMVVEWFVRGTEPKTMCNMDYIYLVDSLDDFYSYPWGSLAYYTMSQGVEAAVVASSAVRYTVCGCVFPLQIWAVERVPALRECVVSYVPYQIPRFIQYRGWKGWRYNKIHAIFESKATFVIMTLEPTLQEWEMDAVRLVRDSFQQCLEACLPILIAYRDSKSASERALLIGEMSTAYAVAKQRDKPYAKAIWCCEQVYAPVNHNNSHWFLMVIYPRKREIVIVDSLRTNALLKYKQKIKAMTEALPILFHATGDSTALEGKKWTAKVDESAPKQDNGYDCGIFVMKFIDILCSGLTLAGTDMRKFTAIWRKSIAYDCLSVN